MQLVNRILPKTVSNQLLLLVALSLILAQTVNLYILVGENRLRARANIIETVIGSVVSHVRQLPTVKEHELPFELRGRQFRDGRFFLSANSYVSKLDTKLILKGYDNEVASMLNKQLFNYQHFELALRPVNPKKNNLKRGHNLDHRPPPRRHKSGPKSHLPPPKGDHRKSRPDTSDELILSIQLPSGVWFNGVVPHSSIESLTPRILFSTLALLSITLIGVAFFMRRITKPLSDFAQAANEFGRGNDPDELVEGGPEDIRKAAQAFNQMQRRLSRVLDTQRNMLRAVGHDLRTPLTSLRIRSEMIPNELQRNKIITTIDEMTAMTEEIVAWTKNSAGLEDIASVDLHSLLSSIVDDFSDQNEDATLHCAAGITLKVRRLAVKRALTNVINNAIKYGGCAHVSVDESEHTIDIHVDDQGPGIPDHLLSDAIKPFVRLEASRNKDTGGSGLGLSITEAIIQTAGGKLVFENLQPTGLRVTLCLPR